MIPERTVSDAREASSGPPPPGSHGRCLYMPGSLLQVSVRCTSIPEASRRILRPPVSSVYTTRISSALIRSVSEWSDLVSASLCWSAPASSNSLVRQPVWTLPFGSRCCAGVAGWLCARYHQRVAFGNLTKLIAEQALGNPVKDVMDALRPPDLSQISDSLRGAKPAGPGVPENAGATMIGQIQAMQRVLKEDDELVVMVNTGADIVRVLEVFVPSWTVFVLTGIDTDKNITRVVSSVDCLQLTCKVMKVQPPAKATRIAFIVPRPKE